MPVVEGTLDLSKNISRARPEIIDARFNTFLIEIKNNPSITKLYLNSNCLENRHLPLLLDALEDHNSLEEFDFSYYFSPEIRPNLAPFLCELIASNPKIKEISLIGCKIHDEELEKILTDLPEKAVSEVYFDFSRNKLTSKSADLAISLDVDLCTLDRLKYNINIDSNNPDMLKIINEIIEGEESKPSPTLTAYYNTHSNLTSRIHDSGNPLDKKGFKLIK